MIRSQNVITSTTWANKPSAYITGQPVFMSNVGTKGSHWFYDGTRWKPQNGSALLASLDAVSSNYTNSAGIPFQYQLPAGTLQTGDILRLYFGASKSGTTDTCGITFRMGTAGTSADTSIVATTLMAAGTRQVALIADFRLDSATTLRPMPSGASSAPGYIFSSSAAFPTAVTISSASANALYFNVELYSGGTTDTVAATHAQLHVISKAN